MQRPATPTPKRAAVLFGAAFAFVFLTSYDPDAMPPGILSASKWLVLFPAALALAMRRPLRIAVSGLSLAGGIFVGVCIAAILHSSNIWPIAGVYWTVIWALPIILGSAAAALLAWAGKAR